MFIENKYSNCYYNIINRAKSRQIDSLGYIEKHHIIPKSLGGTNAPENLVQLTAKEHFICHLLLPKMTTGDQKRKMIHAAWRMAIQKKPDQKRYKVSSKVYEMIKIQRSEYLKTLVGPLNPNYGNKTGRTSADFTPQWRANISSSKKGKTTWNKGIERTDEEKAKISATRKLKSGTPGWNTRPPCSVEKASKIREANTGKKWIHNPKVIGERKQLNLQDCEQYLLLGWCFGIGPRIPRS